MKRLLFGMIVVFCSRELMAAGKSARCCPKPSAGCATSAVACTSRVEWYQAKDGTFREKLPYWTALSRAEDADDLEIRLRTVETEMAGTQAESRALQQAAESQRAELESQLAELKQQLSAERELVAGQKKRLEDSEAARSQAAEQIVVLTTAGKQAESELSNARRELQTVAAERDALRTSSAELQKTVTELSAARNAAAAALVAAQDEMSRLRQAAAVTKKPEVQDEPSEKKDGEEPDAAAGGAPADAKPNASAEGSDAL